MRKLLFLSLLILAFVVEASSGFPETVRSGFFTTAACRSVVLMQQNGRVFGKPVLYESACPSSDGFIAVKSNGRWSYLDCATGQILRAGLTDASRFRGGVARIKDEQGWAFLFTDGRELDLAGEYSYVGIPKDGLCSVVMDGKVGFIDHEGKIVIPPKFDVPFGRDGREHLNLLWFNEGYCIVREGSAQFFINPEGEVLKSKRAYFALGCFNNGRAPVKLGDLCTYLTPRGELLDMSLQDARFFSGDYAVVRTKEGRSAVIDTEGALAYRCETGESIIGHVAAGKVLVFQENSGIYTYLELSSAKKCGNYTFATPYLWGFATVESDEGRRLIDANGVSVAEESYILERMNLNSTGPTVLESTTQTPELFPVALAFNRVFELGSFLESKRVVSFPHWLTTDFSEGVAVFAFETGDKEVSYGFCYADGELLTSLPFSEARSFSCGVAAVREKHSGLWGYINKSGKWINGKRYNNAWSFHNGFAVVESGEEERYAIIDRSGNELWRAPPGHRILESHGPYWPVEIYRKLHGRKGLKVTLVGRTYYVDHLGQQWPKRDGHFFKGKGFSEGLAFVRIKKDRFYSLINSAGTPVTKNKFSTCGKFSEGLCAVKMSYREKWSVIDSHGQLAIDCKYDRIGEFKDGIAVIYRSGMCGAIDVSGHFVVPLIFGDVYR